MKSIEREAWFAYWVVMKRTTIGETATKFGITYNHLRLVLKGERKGNPELKKKISRFIKRDVKEVFKS